VTAHHRLGHARKAAARAGDRLRDAARADQGNAFTYDGGTANTSQLPFPADVAHGLNDKIGVRISVTAGGGTGGTTRGDVECRVFNPNASSALLASDPKYAMKLAVTPSSRWIASGDVGAYASGSKSQLHSMDILKGP
jgi:hypothetical protein